MVVNILCIFSQEMWESTFNAQEREKIIDVVINSKVAKIDCSKFIGH